MQNSMSTRILDEFGFEKANEREKQIKGLFTNYVYKRRRVGSPKMSTFRQLHKVENVNKGEVGGQKKDGILSMQFTNDP